jgi:uncharacterized protein YciI
MELLESHWSFMDHYADVMIARGPTLAADDEGQMTGSMHLVDLPDAAEAQVFAFEEPYYKGGLFAEVTMRRWRNTLGRTMWDFGGSGGRRFLAIGHGAESSTAFDDELHDQQLRYLESGGYSEGVIACGPLLSENGSDWLGTVMLVELADRAAAEAMMSEGPYAKAGLYEAIEIHNWRFGGRPPQ